MAQISQMEALLLGEEARSHELAIEKLACYIGQVQDPELRSLLQRHQGKMQQHYQQICSFVQGNIPGDGGFPGATTF